MSECQTKAGNQITLTLPVEQEILPSDNYGTASLVEVVLCTWAGRRQLSTPTLTYSVL